MNPDFSSLPNSPRRANSTGKQSQSGLQFRANNLVKRLGMLTTKLAIRADKRDRDRNPYRASSSRSLDLLQSTKPYMSQPMLAINFQHPSRHSTDMDGSSRGHTTNSDNDDDSRKPSLSVDAATQNLNLNLKQIKMPNGPITILQLPAPPPEATSDSSSSDHTLATTTLPSNPAPSPTLVNHLSNLSVNVSLTAAGRSITHEPSVNAAEGSSAAAAKRPAIPRLATLPPLKTAHLMETADRRVRLSPSVIVRAPPFPILNLPTVSVPEPGSETPRPGARRSTNLNAMPMLPREGSDDREQDHDHEHDLMEDEDGDDDDDIDAHEHERAFAFGPASDDEDGDGDLPEERNTIRSRPFLPEILIPKRNFSSLLAGVGLATSSSANSTGIANSSQLNITANPVPSAADKGSGGDNIATPKVSTGRWDYFSSKVPPFSSEEQQTHVKGSTTPRATTPSASSSDDAPSSHGLLAGSSKISKTFSEAPTGVPSALSTPRPGLYHQASKSMVNLSFVPRDLGIQDSLRSSRALTGGGADAKGKAKGSETNISTNNAPFLNVHDGLSEGMSTTDGDGPRSAKASTGLAASAVAQDHYTAPPTSPTLRRQRSMPTFNASGPPPPYPSFLPEHLRRVVPAPRDEEGKETLPQYTNDIKLVAIMPRKMEFSAPNVPAKDRKWRRVHCVLEGTAFKVYRCPPSVSGVGVFGGWWENKVGVGDVALMGGNVGTKGGHVVIPKKEPRRPLKWEEELNASEQVEDISPTDTSEAPSPATTESQSIPVPHRSRRSLAVNLLHPNRSRISVASSRSHSTSPSPSPSPFATPRSSMQLSRPSTDISSSGSSTTLTSSASSSHSTSTFVASSSGSQTRSQLHTHRRNTSSQGSALSSGKSASQSSNEIKVPDPHPKDLLRTYTMQNAESGLASDYYKRKNVVRVRMEGEQFLLQCTDVAGVIEWIEGLQAAANVALDLDERPMPKGPLFPRRRRRRRQQRPAEAGTAGPNTVTIEPVSNAAPS